MAEQHPERFPGYDVQAKRHTPSWNAKTRQVVDQRLAVDAPRFFTPDEYATVQAITARIVPTPPGRTPIPAAALVDDKLHQNKQDGFRHAGMPRARDAWRQGLQALDAEAQHAHGKPFRHLFAAEQDYLLKRMQQGALKAEEWGSMKPELFFKQRMAHDLVYAFYSHPISWNMIGWGGPASPRGYVRMGYDQRDPWEAAEAKDGDADTARRKNKHVV